MGIDFGITEAIAVAGLAASAAGTVSSVMAQQAQAQAAANAAEYQAQVAQNQNQVSQQQAKQTEAAGETVQEQIGQQTRANIGALKAAQAASGTDVNSGSNVDVRSSAAALGQLNEINARSNYSRQAYGYQLQGVGYQAQAGLDRAQGEAAKTAGNIGAFGSLASGASSVAKQYASWQQASAPGAGGGSNPSSGAAGRNFGFF